MSLRPRASPGPPASPPEPDTPAAHYTDRLDLGTEASRIAAAAHVHEHGVRHGGWAGARSRWAARLRRKGKFGLSQRAWLAITIIIGFVLLTKLIVPSETATNPTVEEFNELKPHDYLNNSMTEPAPFEFCPVFGPGDAIAARRGQFELLRSRVHTGTGARIHRVLRKAMKGLPVTISVLGGSVTACHGAGDDPIAPECYPARLFNWWNSVFPHPANELTNGAVKRTDSAYYAYCSRHHLPDQTDLVILEFDTSDPNDREYLEHFELLVRSLLVRDDKPAVIILGHFSPQVQAQNGYAGPELLHNVVAQFYDVPHISAKGLLYDQYFERPDRVLSESYFGSHLINKDGHDMMADVVISYLMSQICTSWSSMLGYSFNTPALIISGESGSGVGPFGGLGLRPNQEPGLPEKEDAEPTGKNAALEVPSMRLQNLPNDAKDFHEVQPYCVSAADLVNPLPESIFYGSGWVTYHPPENAIGEDRFYWYAEQPTSRLRVPLRIGAGDVGIYFIQHPLDKPAATVKCWVDDNMDGAKTLRGNAETEEPIATLQLIDHNVSPGSHFVECMLDGEKGGPPLPFKILAM
ncbi:uncharacterized protein COLE_01723 [Cutaneotrichosporon oleaginosum]|uniref:uncharacterized protein n=1 Tax=Cutaneotrichosporon oleaginosum TaxID=879819 RepID=UPI00132CBBCE|nr:hypothetical protein COLE_01723 [Cutaneotrichosporon oleaginosum]